MNLPVMRATSKQKIFKGKKWCAESTAVIPHNYNKRIITKFAGEPKPESTPLRAEVVNGALKEIKHKESAAGRV